MNGPTYDLHSLGWHSFQQLCLSITRSILGQTVESFLDSNDGGRDGAFSGTWIPSGTEDLSGRFVIQCKFSSKRDHNLRLSDLSDEVAKAGRLAKLGHSNCYLLLTNAGVSGRATEAIIAAFERVGVEHVRVLGATWICQQIQESKHLRMMVPRLYGLGDLSQILDERAYSQASALLSSLREDLAKVVVTSAYQSAAAALSQHSFVLLIGEPAAGKTTIASLLAMAALDQWRASPLKLDDPGKLIQHWNPLEPSQFFWIDDAFGVTQYESHLVHGWNHILSQVQTLIRRGGKIVMTSRDYIYNRARKDLKESAFPLMRESQVVVDVHKLTIGEKRQILYNHLKLGRQPISFRRRIKPHLAALAVHPRFVPETARRLSEPLLTSHLLIERRSLEDFVERQAAFLKEVLQGLDADSTAALALVYMRNGNLESPINLQASESDALERLGSTLGGCVLALEALKGSLIQHIQTEGTSYWRFKHPTVGDAYASLLMESPELLGIFVQGSPVERLIDQITCGQVELENATIVPKSLFPLVLQRLDSFAVSTRFKSTWASTWGAKSRLHWFLTRRCSREFLSLYIGRHPDLLQEVSEPGLLLSAVSEVQLAVRLHEDGLFPEGNRRKFIETVTEYAVNGQDLHALQDFDLRAMFSEEELAHAFQKIRSELLPRIDKVRLEWQAEHVSDDDAEEHMQPFVDGLETIRKEFSNDPQIEQLIQAERKRVKEWIEEQEPEKTGSPDRRLADIPLTEGADEERSIFDDIDAE